ncbi:DUF4199 domain-containing protein [Geofilum rubicundum]|uniref:DUF4199 domain-containing protein n=1 Tax=Geofilum rubicundum JCM 15548 TaxID=1236989 RepID=A0A0E9LXF7_9BACT|nr:DUF4199 domain-containing protein [Geofilum rubicundum]GAO29545.1 hypothetical protein JCM15548_11744 [Geofilum rubicundum JCM 15548]
MDNNNSARTQYLFSSGAKLGIGISLFLFLLYVVDKMFGSAWAAFSWIIYGAIIYQTMRGYRDKFHGGFLSYGQGLLFGIRISTLAGIIIGFYYFIMFSFVDPSLRDLMFAEAEEAYLALGMSESAVENMQGSIEMSTNPWVLLISNAIGGLFNGLIVSLVVALFVKRKGDPFQEVMRDVQ